MDTVWTWIINMLAGRGGWWEYVIVVPPLLALFKAFTANGRQGLKDLWANTKVTAKAWKAWFVDLLAACDDGEFTPEEQKVAGQRATETFAMTIKWVMEYVAKAVPVVTTVMRLIRKKLKPTTS